MKKMVWRIGTLDFHPRVLNQDYPPIRVYLSVTNHPLPKRKHNMRRFVRVKVTLPEYCLPTSPRKPDLITLRNLVAVGKLPLSAAIGVIKSWGVSKDTAEFMEEQVIPERSTSFTPPNHRPHDLDYYDKKDYTVESPKGPFNFEYYDAKNDFSTTPDETQGSPPQMPGVA